MAAKVGSFRHSFMERSKERLLSRKGYPGGPDGRGGDRVKRWFRTVSEGMGRFWHNLGEVFVQLYEMGRSDPRKVVFAAKMGLSLALISLLIFFKEPLKNIGQYSVWAVLTVVVVFEFSVGNQSSHTHTHTHMFISTGD